MKLRLFLFGYLVIILSCSRILNADLTDFGRGSGGGSGVSSWNDLQDIPAGFSDNTDDVGSGGGSALEVFKDGVYSSSPVATLRAGAGLSVAGGSGSTATFKLLDNSSYTQGARAFELSESTLNAKVELANLSIATTALRLNALETKFTSIPSSSIAKGVLSFSTATGHYVELDSATIDSLTSTGNFISRGGGSEFNRVKITSISASNISSSGTISGGNFAGLGNLLIGVSSVAGGSYDWALVANMPVGFADGTDDTAAGGGDQWGSHTATRPVNYANQPFFDASSGTVNGDMKVGILIVTGSIQGQGATDPLYFTSHTITQWSIGGSSYDVTASSWMLRQYVLYPASITTWGTITTTDTIAGGFLKGNGSLITGIRDFANGVIFSSAVVNNGIGGIDLAGSAVRSTHTNLANDNVNVGSTTVKGTITSTSGATLGDITTVNRLVGTSVTVTGTITSTSGINGADWNYMFNIPAGFADAVDDVGAGGNAVPGFDYILSSNVSRGPFTYTTGTVLGGMLVGSATFTGGITVPTATTILANLTANVTDFFSGCRIVQTSNSSHTYVTSWSSNVYFNNWLVSHQDSSGTWMILQCDMPEDATALTDPVIPYFVSESTGTDPGPHGWGVAIASVSMGGNNNLSLAFGSTNYVVCSSATAGIYSQYKVSSTDQAMVGWKTVINLASQARTIFIKIFPTPSKGGAGGQKWIRSMPFLNGRRS